MRHPLLIAWICWSSLCGGAGIAAAMIGMYIGLDSLARRWLRRWIWWRGRTQREANLAALETIMHSLKYLDQRVYSSGIWRELRITPAEHTAARNIILQAWDEVLTEAYR